MSDEPQILDPMRSPCSRCGCCIGVIETRSGQDCVFCKECRKWNYNQPKTESGRAVRSTQTVHASIKPKLRAKILTQANGRCELCGKSGADCVLHVQHIIPVAVGMSSGMADTEINDPENLCCLCDECNLGLSDEPMPLKFVMKLLLERIKFRKANDAN